MHQCAALAFRMYQVHLISDSQDVCVNTFLIISISFFYQILFVSQNVKPHYKLP